MFIRCLDLNTKNTSCSYFSILKRLGLTKTESIIFSGSPKFTDFSSKSHFRSPKITVSRKPQKVFPENHRLRNFRRKTYDSKFAIFARQKRDQIDQLQHGENTMLMTFQKVLNENFEFCLILDFMLIIHTSSGMESLSESDSSSIIRFTHIMD